MARRITEEDRIRINELYLSYGTYAAVARETGFAPSTVKKYVVKDFVPTSQVIADPVTIEIVLPIDELLMDFNQDVCKLKKEEEEEIKEVWKEMTI